MTKQMTRKEIAESKTMTEYEKQKMLNEMRAPYKAMSDEELLQLVRDFTQEYGREPMRKDVLYDGSSKNGSDHGRECLKKQELDRSRKII